MLFLMVMMIVQDSAQKVPVSCLFSQSFNKNKRFLQFMADVYSFVSPSINSSRKRFSPSNTAYEK